MRSWKPITAGFLERHPDRLTTIDSHTQGEPTRLLVGGVANLPGITIKQKRDHFESHFDAVRLLLTREPRGHRGIMAAVVTEPVSSQASFGMFYMDARRYPYLCGHATIGAVTTLIECGALDVADGERVITVDTPSGPLGAHTRIERGRVESVAIDMVPSFVLARDRPIEVPGFGRLAVDLVCVGGFFAMVSAASIGIDLTPANSHRLIPLGMAVIEAANRTLQVAHPERPEVNSVDVTEFHDFDRETMSGKSIVVYGESHMDRSPCGTGTTAQLTLLHHQGRLEPGQVYLNTGPLGTVFEGQIVRTLRIGGVEAVVGRIRGSARVTGYHHFLLDDRDPFDKGFLL